ncbi:alginate export family protein [Leptolyngbya sp. KIOST-1]|uniref:alginate export family protein n=1 Tax=Leptolyngbya sp. KIOST-1 TaxID=1229172 RepID=UPI0012E058FC|nr:alginate export family protein [Leptolyngbya sp. KIOST-1]
MPCSCSVRLALGLAAMGWISMPSAFALPTVDVGGTAADLTPFLEQPQNLQPQSSNHHPVGVRSPRPAAPEITHQGVSFTADLPAPESAEALPLIDETQPLPDPLSIVDPNVGLRIPPQFGEGLPIEQVFIYLRNPTGDPAQDEALQQQLADTFGIRAGGSFSSLFADQGLNQVQRLPFVESAEYRLYESNRPSTVILALLVTLQLEPAEASPPPPTGIAVSGSLADFPTIYQSDRSLVKIIFNGGLGIFSDTNPWFGRADNFVSGSYQPTGTVTWGEFYLEPGLAGITRLGDWPFYVYGAGSYTLSGTVQPDIFRTDGRFYGAVEDLYGGFLVAAPGSPVAFNLSAGRQIFQLNQGFLFSQFSGSANALDRGASYSNPRTAYDMTVLANLRWGDFRWQGFFLDSDELPVADTGTQYLGTSLNYNNNQGLEAVLSYITVPQSNRAYLLPNGDRFTREGLQVINPRLRQSTLFGVPGLWAEGEYAYQFSSQQAMAAQGGYFWLGYTAETVPWRPSLSYRFAGFSGDNPNTVTYERFDPLQAGGLSDWLQGISLGKLYNNSNSFSHRVTLSAQPSQDLSISLDYYYRFADELNNLGGNPALSTLNSRYIGQEFLLTTRYFLSQNFMLQGVGAIAFPGSAVRQAANNDTSPWVTLQLSLFMFF